MNGTPFAARLAAVVIAVVIAANGLAVTLDYLKFRKVLHDEENALHALIAGELRDTIEDSMNLGLPMAMLQNIEQLIARRRAGTAGIAGITVFDSLGAVVFDTDRFRVGKPLPQAWQPPAERPDWTGELSRSYLVGTRIVNNFDQPAGGVVVRYEAGALEARMNAILLDMMRTALLVLAGTAAVAVTASMLLTRAYRRWFAAAAAGIEAAILPPADGDASLDPSGLTAAIRSTGAALDRTEQEVMLQGTVDGRAG